MALILHKKRAKSNSMLQSKPTALLVLLIFIAFVAINPACAQSKINVDSLARFCDNYPTADTLKLKALIKISEAYQSKNQLKGIAYGEKAIQLATQLDNKNLLANAYQVTGKNMVRNSRYPDALVLFEKALEIQKNANNQAAIGRLYIEKSVLYRRTGDLPNALKMNELGMPLLEKTNQQKEIALAYNNMGTLYMSTSDYLLAINFLQKAISINEKIGELELLSVNFNNMGYIQVLLSDYNTALISLNKALEINQKLDNKMWIAMHYDNIGLAYLGLKQYDKALEILHKALAINEEIGNKTSESINLNNIGKTQIALGKYPEAIIALFRSIEMCSKASDRYTEGLAYCQLGTAYEQSTVALKDGANRSERLKKAIFHYQNALDISAITKTIETQSASWQGLSKVYKEQGLYSKAFDAFEKHITLKDSIGGADIKKQVARKEIEYEFGKKETELKYQQQFTTGELEKQRLLTVQGEQALTLNQQNLTLKEQALALSNKETDLAHLAYLKEQAEKQEKTQELSLSQEREKGKERDLSLKNLELSAQQKQNLYWGLFSFFLLGGLGVLSYFYTTLKKQKNIIAQQNELNEQTIAILSHDIKEPLLGVKLLLKKLNKDDPFVAQASQSLEGQINSVNGILTNLLKMKKLSLVKKDKNATANAQSVVNNVTRELSVAIQSKSLTIQNDLETDVTLPIGSEKLQIIVHNLLSNAVKYSFPNQTIRIFKEGKGICIQDFGIGLSPEQRSKLMREVTASQQGTSQERGNGLGLFLVGTMLQGEQLKVVFDSPEVGGTIAKVLG
jgi:tetratricopeptide (TPR) repeat protein